jgi:hypothetical protein
MTFKTGSQANPMIRHNRRNTEEFRTSAGFYRKAMDDGVLKLNLGTSVSGKDRKKKRQYNKTDQPDYEDPPASRRIENDLPLSRGITGDSRRLLLTVIFG